MPRKISFAMTAALLFVCFGSREALAQSDLRKTEVGVQFSIIHLENFDTGLELFKREFPQKSLRDTVGLGVGGRFTFNFNRHLGLEAEVNFFPERPSFIFEGRRKLQAVFGPKIGIRKERVGVFGKVRPGFMHFSDFARIVEVVRGPTGDVLTVGIGSRHNFFALDIGGVVELYPSRRTVVRFDLGDTIIHTAAFHPTSSILRSPDTTYNSALASAFDFEGKRHRKGDKVQL